jgi:hypothetical protein
MVEYFKSNIISSTPTFPSFSSPSFLGFEAKHGEHVECLDLDRDARVSVGVGSVSQACPSVDTPLFNAGWPLSSPSSIASANENGVNRNGDVLGGTIHSNIRRIGLQVFKYAFRKTERTQVFGVCV